MKAFDILCERQKIIHHERTKDNDIDTALVLYHVVKN